MDPIHLLSEELDYELDIRGVNNLSNQRQKTTCLREYLRKEAMGESSLVRMRVEGLDTTTELAQCGLILQNIIAEMHNRNFDPKQRLDCKSRLIHVTDRVKRVRPITPEEQTEAYEILSLTETQLAVFPNPFRSQTPVPVAKPNSPLEDILETIRVAQQSANVPLQPVNILTVENQIRESSGETRRSLLNPRVQEFVPEGGAIGGVATNQAFNKSGPPPYSSSNPSRTMQAHDRYGPPARDPVLVSNASRPNLNFRFDNNVQDDWFFQVPAQPRRAESLSSRGDPIFNGYQEQRQAFRPTQRSVPVHQWKLTYSGDGHGLHLYDFLAELRMFQRSEGVTDEELFSSVVHLLSGRARFWYRSCFDDFDNWNGMVAAMKAEFLPPKYDYKLLSNISNRRQKTTETFAEYYNTMQSMFRHLSIPVNDQHKLSIIEDNMLPKYAVATSVIEITTLEQLSSICRRVDFAYAKTSFHAPQDRVTDPRPYRGNFQRVRDVHELASGYNFSGDELNTPYSSSSFATNLAHPNQPHPQRPCREAEILEMRRNNSMAPHPPDSSQRECFNCLRIGHTFASCTAPRNGQFCFRCGSRDVVSFHCKKCAKNGNSGSVAREGLPNPSTQ